MIGLGTPKDLLAKTLHSVSPVNISFDKKTRNNKITLSNKGDKKLYFTFSVSKKQEDGKMLDITELDYFKAVPHKFILAPGEMKKANIFIKNISAVPEGEYILHFTPEKTDERVKMGNVDGRELYCDVVVRYSIKATVTH